MRFKALTMIAFAITSTPASAQDLQTSMDYTVATGQATVLDSMNRAQTKRRYRKKGLTPPDERTVRRRPVGDGTRQSDAEVAADIRRKCSVIRARYLHRLNAAQMRVYRRGCT